MDRTTKRNFISREVLKQFQSQVKQQLESTTLQDDTRIAGWFMGTKGENLDLVKKLLSIVVERTVAGRIEAFPEDPEYITDTVKTSEPYLQAINDVEAKSEQLLRTVATCVPNELCIH